MPTLPSSISWPVLDWLLTLRRPAALLSLIALMLIALPFLGVATGLSDHSSPDSSRVSSQVAQTPDFSIGATSPQPVNINQSTISTIVVNALNSFSGSIAINGTPSYGLTCGSILPPLVHDSGIATVSCSAITGGTYDLTVTGTSGSLTHATTASFNFVDFKIRAVSPIGAASTSLVSTISIIALNGFNGDVAVTAVAQSGLTCGLVTPTDIIGSGTATVSCSATSIGVYILTVNGKSGSLTHSASATFKVAALAADTPDVSLTMSVVSLSLNPGASGTATVTVTPQNGFTGTITLTVSTPAGIVCSLNPTHIQSSCTSTLTCNSRIPGDYAVTITSTGGAVPHTRTLTVKVAAVSPAAPAPSTILGLSQTVYSAILAVIIIIVVAETVLLLRMRRPGRDAS